MKINKLFYIWTSITNLILIFIVIIMSAAFFITLDTELNTHVFRVTVVMLFWYIINDKTHEHYRNKYFKKNDNK